NFLTSVGCTSTTACIATGALATVIHGPASGAWSSPTTGNFPASVTSDLLAIGCGAACIAVGENGAAVSTANGGLSWTSVASGTGLALQGISCAGAGCFVAGVGGSVLNTATLGTSEDIFSLGTGG